MDSVSATQNTTQMSLLARISGTTEGGPVRPKSANRGSPYTRPPRPPKGDPNAQWSHDLYDDASSPPLSSRIVSSGRPAEKSRLLSSYSALFVKPLQATSHAANSGSLNIKGASGSSGNVIQVEGLVKGTTAADVEAIFRRCGAILSSELASSSASSNVIVRLTFKKPADAHAAVSKFDGQPADGRILRVRVVGVQAVSLPGRIAGVNDIVDGEGSVDVLMGGDGTESGSKMRSDSIMANDPRATVLVAPPGADPKVYTQPEMVIV
ncbi:hypothetical protein F5J12DRAFT_91562 [Pisolithus orientalis]|uniref:uncharacterized protein n=1 Tax=Pisolithus orientalis TaxID=936130 RepID=UPI002225958F|nr:uncharacterized protein F5J12DRAFT_91562 [Pisolithus orientalis]KAI6007791.1 hypothetical protein F5J12DRAFT_91562 [Pisolithus orientalis]